ncbi:MAG: UTP--glucose-1-phosphate uridylyltransferase [Oscillospiraceae bacterium]|jgi:UTP--glucose-1-phosphate uridylyltransferase|nr:UTP--glucose-1-phosphate uridylyltransferase [Oscillospiraceae bacterium]
MQKVKKAIIPAAGLGTRVLPASKAVPKEMLNIVDKPAIQYIVEEAVAAGIEDILIITNRGKGVIEDHFDHAYELEHQLAGNSKKAEILAQVQAVSALANVYFLRQKITKGLGHAVLCGKSFIGDEPFAVMYGDDVIIAEDPVVAQLMRVSEEFGTGVVGVNEVSPKDIAKYCSLGVEPVRERVMRVTDIVEKPTPAQVLSLYSILGRVILPPEIFKMLEDGCGNTPTGEEYYLTDAMADLGKQGKMMAVDFIGKRYDMGNKLGILQANCEVALRHPEIGADARAYLLALAATL